VAATPSEDRSSADDIGNVGKADDGIVVVPIVDTKGEAPVRGVMGNALPSSDNTLPAAPTCSGTVSVPDTIGETAGSAVSWAAIEARCCVSMPAVASP
jgi:hypothetical protein